MAFRVVFGGTFLAREAAVIDPLYHHRFAGSSLTHWRIDTTFLAIFGEHFCCRCILFVWLIVISVGE